MTIRDTRAWAALQKETNGNLQEESMGIIAQKLRLE
jgi:hypothetical protein